MKSISYFEDLNNLIKDWECITHENPKKHISQQAAKRVINDIQKVFQETLPNLKRLYLHKSDLQCKDLLFRAISVVKEIQSCPSVYEVLQPSDSKKIQNELFRIEHQLTQLCSEYQVIDQLTYQTPLKDHLKIKFESFLSFFFKNLQKKINRAIFAGAAKKEKMEDLACQIEKLDQQILAKKSQMEELEKTLQQASGLNKKENSERQVSRGSIESYKSQIDKILQEIQELSKTKNSLSPELDKWLEGEQKSQETRENLRLIGGESVRLDLPKEKTSLNGTYISANQFRKKIIEAKAQVYDLKTDEKTRMTGFIFSSQDQIQHSSIMQALEQLGAFEGEDKEGCGWCQIQMEDGRVLLMLEEEAKKLEEQGYVQNNQFITNDDHAYSLETKNLDVAALKPENEQATVLLTSGSMGVYEMHKQEILAFLLRGMNVMTFNFRGYGNSTGVPSSEGWKHDMDAVYHYLKTKHDLTDDKLLIKALCLSGGPASYLAAKHPHAHLLLDQTYAGFAEFVLSNVNESFERFLKKDINPQEFKEAVDQLPVDPLFKQQIADVINPSEHRLKFKLFQWILSHILTITSYSFKQLIPSWSPQQEIRQVRGHVGLIVTSNDTLMSKNDEIIKNCQALCTSNTSETMTILGMPGEHGDLWVKAKEAKYIYNFTDEYVPRDDTMVKKLIETYQARYPAFKTPAQDPMSDKEFDQFLDETFSHYSEFTLNRENLIQAFSQVSRAIENREGVEGSASITENIKEAIKVWFEDENAAYDAEVLLKQAFFSFEDILDNLYDGIVEGKLNRKESVALLDSFPDHLKEYGESFINDLFQLPEKKVLYVGRTKMDRFLSRAGLKGQLVY